MPFKLRSVLTVLAASTLVLATAGPSVQAQGEPNLHYDPAIQRGSLFGPRIIAVPQPRVRAPVRRVLTPAVVRQSPALPTGTAVLPIAKVNPSIFVVVLGDTLGELLATGLDEALADVPNAAVVRKTRADSGLVRSDFHDWPKVAREILAGDQKISVGVMLLGANDRQAIREGDLVHEPLSDRWRELYRERIDGVTQAFSERRIPLIWVGAPPMQNSRLSGDLVILNDLFRQRAERTGAVYVDLWPGFVDGENRFSVSGPDLSGQIARLRTNDGVHFTRSGARKAAHFADVALRRLLPDIAAGPALASTGPVPAVPGLALSPSMSPSLIPAPGLDNPPLPVELQPGGIERLIDQMARLGTGLDSVSLPEIRVKPIAGPILPLTGPPVTTGGLLLPNLAAARGTGQQAAELKRVFDEGRAPSPAPGRADDFRWPRTP